LTWNLESDYNLSLKVKTMQENVVGTAHLIHNSMNELTRAIHCAHTTLYNSVNAFNALNFNKFLENVGTDSILINSDITGDRGAAASGPRQW